MVIKHIHASVGAFNGSLYFLVDNRLLRVGVGTPLFNDYNEWRLDEFTISSEPYNPEGNAVELQPFEFSDIEIDDSDLRMIEFGSKLSDVNYDFDEEEYKNLREEFPDVDPYISGIMYKTRKRMTISGEDFEGINLTKWHQGRKTSFQKVFFPILEQFRIGYLKHNNIKY